MINRNRNENGWLLLLFFLLSNFGSVFRSHLHRYVHQHCRWYWTILLRFYRHCSLWSTSFLCSLSGMIQVHHAAVQWNFQTRSLPAPKKHCPTIVICVFAFWLLPLSMTLSKWLRKSIGRKNKRVNKSIYQGVLNGHCFFLGLTENWCCFSDCRTRLFSNVDAIGQRFFDQPSDHSGWQIQILDFIHHFEILPKTMTSNVNCNCLVFERLEHGARQNQFGIIGGNCTYTNTHQNCQTLFYSYGMHIDTDGLDWNTKYNSNVCRTKFRCWNSSQFYSHLSERNFIYCDFYCKDFLMSSDSWKYSKISKTNAPFFCIHSFDNNVLDFRSKRENNKPRT